MRVVCVCLGGVWGSLGDKAALSIICIKGYSSSLMGIDQRLHINRASILSSEN